MVIKQIPLKMGQFLPSSLVLSHFPNIVNVYRYKNCGTLKTTHNGPETIKPRPIKPQISSSFLDPQHSKLCFFKVWAVE